jgi:hypothetical protein
MYQLLMEEDDGVRAYALSTSTARNNTTTNPHEVGTPFMATIDDHSA